MKQTLMLRLDPSVEQRTALKATMQTFNAAATEMAAWATEHDTSSKWAIQAGCYHVVRERHGLSAQMTVRAIKVAADAQKRLPKGRAATFRAHGAVVYDSRIMSFKGAENVSLWTVEGRQLIPMRLGDYQRARMERQRGEADLLLRDGVFYLAVCLDAPEPSPLDAVGTLGVAMLTMPRSTDSDAETHSGEQIERCRARYAKRRAVLQAVGTRSARRRLAKTRRREARFRRDRSHIISKQIVGKAQDTKRQIAVEELTGIRARTTAVRLLAVPTLRAHARGVARVYRDDGHPGTADELGPRAVRRSQRSRHAGWAFAQLRAFIGYKARLACGHAAPADVNAARNIASRGEVMRPKVRGGLHLAA